jgi:hypothetical protein
MTEREILEDLEELSDMVGDLQPDWDRLNSITNRYPGVFKYPVLWGFPFHWRSVPGRGVAMQFRGDVHYVHEELEHHLDQVRQQNDEDEAGEPMHPQLDLDDPQFFSNEVPF